MANMAACNLIYPPRAQSARAANVADGFASSVLDMEVYLCVRFEWMRVKGLESFLSRLAEILQRQSVAPLTFKRLLATEVCRTLPGYQRIARLLEEGGRVAPSYE